MERFLALVVLTVVAVAIALVLQRRRPNPPSVPSYRAPEQLDRDDFANREASTLVVMFGSTTCDTCPKVWAAIDEVSARVDDASREAVGFQRIDVQDDAELHRRYRIDGVPTTLIADADGVVRQAFFGPITAQDLAVAIVGPDPT